jgi:DNA-binding CsgD family transcriptional regulator
VTNTSILELKASVAVSRLQAIAEAIKAGENITDIALRMSIPVTALRYVCLPKARLYAGRPRAVSKRQLEAAIVQAKAGKSAKEIAEELKLNPWTLSKALSKADAIPKDLRAERMREAIKLYKQRVPTGEIAKKFCISIPTLYTHLRKAGVPRRPYKKPT